MKIQCLKCGAELEENAMSMPRLPCPTCGSTAIKAIEILTDSAVAYSLIRGVGKMPSLPRDKRLRFDIKTGYEMSRRLGRMVRVERSIDKDADSYMERITDPATGEVIHECIEKLSEHTGHGSAKRKV